MEEGQVEDGGGKVEGLIHKTFTMQCIENVYNTYCTHSKHVPPADAVVMQCSQSNVVLLSLLHCRKYKVRRWFSQIKDAFRNVSNMPDYGLSIAWPEPPPVLKVCEGIGREGGGRELCGRKQDT